MATVHFDIPDDIAETFDEAFQDQDQNAVIADLMRLATLRKQVAETQARLHEKAIARVLERRKHAPTITEEEFRAAREEGRS